MVCGCVFARQGVRFRSTWCGARVHCRCPDRRTEICGDPTDAVPGQVVDMPVTVPSGPDVQKTVETFHSCSSWSILVVNIGAAQWSRLLLPCSKDAFATHSGAGCRFRATGTHSPHTVEQVVVSHVARLTLRIRVVRHDLRLLTELDQRLYGVFFANSSGVQNMPEV